MSFPGGINYVTRARDEQMIYKQKYQGVKYTKLKPVDKDFISEKDGFIENNLYRYKKEWLISFFVVAICVGIFIILVF
ncbi:MAG: hypothetical protein ACLFRI_06915 [Candidatus Izemoplasmataceae bacterium]